MTGCSTKVAVGLTWVLCAAKLLTVLTHCIFSVLVLVCGSNDKNVFHYR